MLEPSESKVVESKTVHTAIEDLLVAGDELPEETLRLVVGGLDGGSTGVCGGCHTDRLN